MVIRVQVDESGNVPFLTQRVAERVWLTTERHMATISSVSMRAISSEMIEEAKRIREKRDASIAAVASRDSTRLQGTKHVLMRDGVAIIPIMGTIVQFADIITEYSGGATVESLQRDFQFCLDNEEVKAILLWFDSPGGEAQGINEFGDLIFAARAIKPVYSYVDAMCCSGAFWLASQTERIFGDKLAMIGSIGAQAIFIDDKEAMAMQGYREIVIKSSVSPKKNPDAATTEGEAQIQVWVDDIGKEFVTAVARGRALTTKEVVERYGAGDIMVGRRAVKAGLMDGISSFEATVKAMASGKIRRRDQNAQASVEGLDPHVESIVEDESDVTDNRRENTVMESDEENNAQLNAEERGTLTTLLGRLGINIGASDIGAGAQVKLSSAQRSSFLAAHRVAAKAFVSEMKSKGHIKPYQMAGFESIYMMNAEDDLDHPREVTFKVGDESVKGTRVDAFMAQIKAMPKDKGLTAEFIDPKANVRELYDNKGDSPDGEDPLGDPEASAKEYAIGANSNGNRK